MSAYKYQNKASWKKRSVRNQKAKDITLDDSANTPIPKGRPKKSTSNVGFVDAKMSDITLNDCANSPVCKNRLKKSTSNVMTVLKKFEEVKSWDEKSDDDFEGDFVQQEDEEGNIIYVFNKSEPRRRKKTISGPSEEGQGNVYPVDIWFLLSKYIRPEDIGRFAGICKTSYQVVCSAQFWYGMYKRYYNSSINLPEDLQMESMFRKYGLRASVVRALHYMYPPYINRLKTISANVEIHPAVLQKRICESLWYTQKINWIYYFKMKEKGTDNVLNHSKTTFTRPDLLEILDDVSANPDENCCVLQVFCKEFAAVPPVIGQILTSVSVTLSNGLRHNRLQLSFGSGIQKDCNTIILDPVINYKVLNWWHPHYPHNASIQDLLNTDEVL